MITTISQLKEVLAYEKPFYYAVYGQKPFYFRFTRQHQYALYRYVRLLRITEYLINTAQGNPFKKLLFWILERRRNRLGNRLGICMTQNVFERGLFIDHIGAITVNPFAKVGANCHIHGSCCIGRGNHGTGCPVIGDNANLGWGCVVIGDITIADNVRIGAGAVVTKSISEPDTSWVGIPARKIEKRS